MRKKIAVLVFFILLSSCEGIIGRRLPREIITVETKSEFLDFADNQTFDAIIEQYGSLIIIILLDGTNEKENIEIERLEFDMEYQYSLTSDGHSQFRDVVEVTTNNITLAGKNKTALITFDQSKADGRLIIKEGGVEALIIKYDGTYYH